MQLINWITIKRHDSLANYELDQFTKHLLSIAFSSSSILALELCVGFGLLHGFISYFFWGKVISPNSTPDLKDERLHFI
jgi:hypothetical protein